MTTSQREYFIPGTGSLLFTSCLALLFFCTVFLHDTSEAQSVWVDYPEGNSATLEIYKPFPPVYERSFIAGVRPEYTAGSSSYFLSGRYEVSKALTIVADFPMVYGMWDDTVEIENEGGFKIGNPYLGIEYLIPQSPATVEFGFRIPVTPEDMVQATTIGTLSDVDRVEAFLPQIVPFTASVKYRTVSDSKILLNARVGADLWFNTKKINIQQQPLLTALYTLQTGYLNKYVHFIFGLSGKYDMDSGTGNEEKAELSGIRIARHFSIKECPSCVSV